MCRLSYPSSPNLSSLAGKPRPAEWQKTASSFLLRELYYMKEFVKYDITSTLFQFSAFFSVALRHSQSDVPLIARIGLLLWVWIFYTLAFIVPGQIYHVEEDRVNKPDRIMVRGELSKASANKRWAAYIGCYMAGSWICGCFTMSLLWVLCGVVHYCTSVLHERFGYLWKNLLLSIGYYVLLTTAWRIAGAEIHWPVIRPILVLCGAVMLTMQVQDLRDVEGDREAKRMTMPVCIRSDVLLPSIAFAIGACGWCWVTFIIHHDALTYKRIHFVHTLALAAGILSGRRLGKVYTLYCLWFVSSLLSLHFSDLSGEKNQYLEDTMSKIDIWMTIAVTAVCVKHFMPKHARKKMATAGVPGYVLTIVSWVFLDEHVSDVKALAMDSVLSKALERIQELENEQPVFHSLLEFQERFWTHATQGRHFESHRAFVTMCAAIINGEFSRAFEVFRQELFSWPRHVYNIFADSSSSHARILKLVLIVTLRDAYAVCIATGETDLLSVAKRLRFIRNMPTYSDDPDVTIITRQVRAPLVGGSVCPFLRHISRCTPHNMDFRFGLLVIEKKHLLEVVEIPSGLMFEDMQGRRTPLRECAFWEDEAYWMDIYPEEKEIIRHDK